METDIHGLRRRLEEIGKQLQTISLGKGCGCPADAGGLAPPRSAPFATRAASADQADLAFVEAFIAARRMRLKFFDDDLLFDPAWSMMLDLYRSGLRGEQLSVTAACLSSGVPETTALRYLRALETRGYVERVSDPNDRRRYFIMLTKPTNAALAEYFAVLQAETFRAHVARKL